MNLTYYRTWSCNHPVFAGLFLIVFYGFMAWGLWEVSDFWFKQLHSAFCVEHLNGGFGP